MQWGAKTQLQTRKMIKLSNLTKVQETEFPAGVLEGQSPSILFLRAFRSSAACWMVSPRFWPPNVPASRRVPKRQASLPPLRARR